MGLSLKKNCEKKARSRATRRSSLYCFIDTQVRTLTQNAFFFLLDPRFAPTRYEKEFEELGVCTCLPKASVYLLYWYKSTNTGADAVCEEFEELGVCMHLEIQPAAQHVSLLALLVQKYNTDAEGAARCHQRLLRQYYTFVPVAPSASVLYFCTILTQKALLGVISAFCVSIVLLYQ